MNNLEQHHHRMTGHMSSSRQARKDRRRKSTVQSRKQLVKPAKGSPIKVRLDHKTIITITKESSLVFWRQRYPQLTILS